MRRLIVCLDGTWNNPYSEAERDDGTKVFRPSNVLKFCRAVKPRADDGAFQLSYYDIGVGALNRYPGLSNSLLRWIDQKLGGAWGAGFEGHIENTYTFLALNYQAGDEIYLVGFSRGAAEVRGLSRFIEWMGGFPTKNDAYYIPELFRRYIGSQGNIKFADVLREINTRRQNEKTPRLPLDPFVPAKVQFLGVWDTVMALGSRLDARAGTSVGNRAFHAGDSPSPIVSIARQALAIDERRYDFRPEIWSRANAGQSLEQRWFAGAHSNVGGGYVHDGLADCALRWMVEEAEKAGLVFDQDYLSHFPRFFSTDTLYDPRNLFYRIREAPVAWLRHETGRRDLLAAPESANLTIDKSALDRLNADPAETKANGELKHPRLVLYRPDNLLRYLAAHPELDAQLKPRVLREVVALRAGGGTRPGGPAG